MSDFENTPDQNDAKFREIIATELGDPLPEVTKFDTERNKLYDHIAEFAANLSSAPMEHSNVEFEIGDLLDAFDSLANRTVGQSPDIDSAIETLIDYFHNDAAERCALLREISGTENIPCIDRELVEANFRECVDHCDNLSQFAQHVTEMYGEDLGSDVNNCVAVLIQKNAENFEHDHEEDMPSFEVKKSAAEHALDVAKIAAGVAIGMALGKMVHRK